MLHAKFSRKNIILFSILTLALILRVFNLESRSMWLDEVVNIHEAEKNFMSWNNSLPPLYFVVLHFWLNLGKSEMAVRSLSVILGVFSVFLIYKTGVELYGEKEGLVSAFLLAISQTAILFSRNAMYYSLFIPLSILSVYYFLKMDKEPTNSNKILFLVSISLDFYSHYFTVLLLLVFIIFKIWKYRSEKNKDDIRSFCILAGIFLVLIAPALPIFISETTSKTASSNFKFNFQTDYSPDFIKNIIIYLVINEIFSDYSILPFIIMGLFLVGVFSSKDNYEKSITLLIMWLCIPIMAVFVLTGFISNLHIRYLVFVLPALLIISSRGILAIPEAVNNLIEKYGVKLNSYIIISVIIIAIVSSSYPVLDNYYKSKEYDWRGAARFIENNAEENSNVILVPGYNSVPFNFYFKSENDINILEYSSFEDLVNISYQNNTYLIITADANGLQIDELRKLSIWRINNLEMKAELSSINIFKNVTPVY